MMSAPSWRRRYLSVWLRRLATDRMTRASSGVPAETPFVIAEPVKSALRIAAMNDAAARLGLQAGMALADAKAMYPALTVADAAPEADRRLLEGIADWCERYTPLVGLDPPDGLLLDVTGCAHLFGGSAALGRDIVQRLAGQGLAARAAIADTVGCAWAVARHHASTAIDRERACTIVPPDGARAALLPLRLSALRIAPATAEGLAQAGLKRIADVIERPRAPLAARFGEHFLRRLDQALGREDEPINPRLPLPAYVAERRFAEPILLETDMLGTIEHLAQKLARRLEQRQEGARRLQVALFRTDGKVYRIEAGTGAPLRAPARIRALFAERLAAIGDSCDPGFGFDVIRLAAPRTERCDPAQIGLQTDWRAGSQTDLAAPDQAAELVHLIDRLGARFGLSRITRLVPQDTHIPEFAVAALPAAHDHRHRAAGKSLLPAARSACCEQDSLAPTRPLRLFVRPEPIEAMAEIPDGPPVRFRWRHVLHQVVHAEGPERIAMEWWRDQSGCVLTRDYFRIESHDGMRVWIYREGLYERETAAPRWFMHGLFA